MLLRVLLVVVDVRRMVVVVVGIFASCRWRKLDCTFREF